jgi:hypothetical protein
VPKVIISIFGIVFIGFLVVMILAKTSTNIPVLSQQDQQLQNFVDSVVFSH